MTTQAQVRAAFWQSHPQFKRGSVPVGRNSSGILLRRDKRQNEYDATIRAAFVDFVDALARSNQIAVKLADHVTL